MTLSLLRFDKTELSIVRLKAVFPALAVKLTNSEPLAIFVNAKFICVIELLLPKVKLSPKDF